MKKILGLFLAVALAAPAWGQSGPTGALPYYKGTTTQGFGATGVGTAGQILTSNGAGVAPTYQTAGGSGAALPNTQIFVGNVSNVATAVAMSRDCTIANTGAITCTKTNNVAFATSATTDTTNASNISSGTLNTAILPSPFTNGTISGSTNKFATTFGTLISGNCVKFDASGNIVDNGSTCNVGGSPGGSNTQVQYNNGGVFGGITGATSNGTTLTLASPAFSGIVTGAGTIPLLILAPQALDTVVANATGGSASPTAVSIGSCSSVSSALTYNTTSHAFGCNTISGSGTVNSASSGNVAVYSAATTVGGLTDFNFSGHQLLLGANGVASGNLALIGTSSGNTVSISVSGSTGGWNMVLPTSAGTVNQFLQTNGSGTTTWATPAGAGTVTSVGYTAGAGLVLSGTASPITGTGSFQYALAPIATDNALVNSTGISAAPIATALGSCSATASALTYNTTSHAFGCNTLVSSIAGNTGAFTLSTGLTNSTNAILIDKATSANLEAGTSNKVLTADIIYDGEVTVTFAASQTLDFNTFLNARITATANTTSLTCSNIKASQSGTITWVQDATGSRTMVAGWCSQFRWAGGTRGVLSTAVNAIDALFYTCVTTAICYVSIGKAQAN